MDTSKNVSKLSEPRGLFIGPINQKKKYRRSLEPGDVLKFTLNLRKVQYYDFRSERKSDEDGESISILHFKS